MKSSCLDFILHNLYFFEVNKINIYGMLQSFKDGWVLLAKALLESKGAQNEEETVCARMFWQRSTPTEKKRLFSCWWKEYKVLHTQTFCAWSRKDRKHFFYAKTHIAFKEQSHFSKSRCDT